MAQQKISGMTELASTPSSGDLIEIVDVSDTSEAATGTNKKVTVANLLAGATVADASTTVKGKVELATDSETITGTDTARAVTPSNITAKIDTDGTLAGNSDTRIPSQKAVKTYADTKTTLATVLSTIASGWTSISATLTYSSADAPTYVCTTSSDLTGSIGVGMRIKLTHSASTKFFIVTAIDASTITFYGGTDYTLSATAITAPYYSNVKAPLGFPLDPTKWQFTIISDTTSRTQAASASTWTNIASLSGNIPIGAWDVDFHVDGFSDRTSAGTGDSCSFALSTANNTASDEELTAMCGYYGSGVASSSDLIGGHATGRKYLVLAAKTTYYLNGFINNAGNIITQPGSAFGGTTRAIARCAYI